MIPLEATAASVAAIGAIISAVFGGGLFRQYLKHNEEAAILRFQQNQTSNQVKDNDVAIQALQQDVALVKRDVVGFREQIKKLDLLPEIMSKLSSIETSIGFMKEQVNRLDNHDRHSN